MSVRVAGADPVTSSLDLLLLDDGRVRDQCRFRPDELRSDSRPARPLAPGTRPARPGGGAVGATAYR